MRAVGPVAAGLGQHVGPGPGAGHGPVGPPQPDVGADHDGGADVDRRLDADTREDAAAPLDHLVGEASADLGVVDDPGGGHEDRRQPDGVGLVLGQPGGRELLDREPVAAAPLGELGQRRHLVGRGGHHDLPAPLPRRCPPRCSTAPSRRGRRCTAGPSPSPAGSRGPEWITPELWPLWWAATSSRSSSTRSRPGRSRSSARAVARPTMPPPTTTTSTRAAAGLTCAEALAARRRCSGRARPGSRPTPRRGPRSRR